MNQTCEWNKCPFPATTEYWDNRGIWFFCDHHTTKSVNMDNAFNALRVGVFGGIFAGFFDGWH